MLPLAASFAAPAPSIWELVGLAWRTGAVGALGELRAACRFLSEGVEARLDAEQRVGARSRCGLLSSRVASRVASRVRFARVAGSKRILNHIARRMQYLLASGMLFSGRRVSELRCERQRL